ncbi:MAG: hypothetical protein PHT07_16385 [Paludibacter sp.]|nr:hypothetical protein [Paludibacter sp.]
MKTSNKLLLGLLALVVICIIIANIALKKHIDTNSTQGVKIEVNQSDSVATADSDSVAMDKALGNE